jgi:hypothetical protein
MKYPAHGEHCVIRLYVCSSIIVRQMTDAVRAEQKSSYGLYAMFAVHSFYTESDMSVVV